MAEYPYIVSFDTETEGLKPDYHKIIEMGAIKSTYDGKVVDTFSKFGDPGRSITPEITRITGITNEMLVGADPSDSVIEEWFKWLGPNCILIAHNASFDIGFVTHPMIQRNISFENYLVVDTLQWARKCFYNLKKHKLGILLEHIGKPAKIQHRAEEDARGAAVLASYMMKKMESPKSPEELFDKFRKYGKYMYDYVPSLRQKETAWNF